MDHCLLIHGVQLQKRSPNYLYQIRYFIVIKIEQGIVVLWGKTIINVM